MDIEIIGSLNKWLAVLELYSCFSAGIIYLFILKQDRQKILISKGGGNVHAQKMHTVGLPDKSQICLPLRCVS